MNLDVAEVILWEGDPNPRVHVALIDIYLFFTGSIFFYMMLFWLQIAFGLVKSKGRRIDLFLAILGVLLLLLSLYFLVFRFFMKARAKRGEHYVITNQRIIILGKKGSVSQALPLGKEMRVHQKMNFRSGNGTLCIGETGYVISGYLNSGLDFMVPCRKAILLLRDIDEVDHVRKLLRRLPR